MPVTLFDSLTRSPRELRPSQPDGVYRFYNCGPTVYAPAHIGNFRTFVVNDLIRRVLELEFGADKVKHVRNITDVDDKTIRRSREEHRALAEVTKQWTDKFHADCDALNCLRPHVEPTATGHIPEQVGMIAELMQKGHAYATADGSVYFKVGSFPGYGALSRVKERELQIGSALSHKPQTADADEKEDGSDFALWKAWKPEDGDVKWPGPAGAAAGRPGWHIECSAMSRKHLGETIDLHTGGEDLLFPHHENEIAQTECCTGHPFALHWYHSKHLMVDGAKMSKSLGNLYTLDDLKAKGFTPMALRYALLAGHPRKQLNFTLDSLHAAEKALETLRTFRSQLSPDGVYAGVFSPVFEALRNDLNTPAALGALFTVINDDRPGVSLAAFDRVLFALGLKLDAPAAPAAEAPAEVKTLAEQRWAAKQAKNWAEADRLRGAIAALGWAMLDSKTDYKLEPAKK
ncbi:MAG TPA: cysteine--tRNA ligase [Opitutaceae bacterium]|nr:cysteine--tRNA ligase [Opitutaceae bacterium]